MATGRAAGVELRLSSTSVDDGVFVVSVGGEIDLYSAPDLLKELRELADAGAQHLVVDLTETSFIDSTGLGILIAATKLLRLQGGELHVAGMHGVTERAIYAAGLHTFFTMSPSVDDALAKI